jgi:two-component system CheB/CheR fusion protein
MPTEKAPTSESATDEQSQQDSEKPASAESAQPAASEEEQPEHERRKFFVVGIGASAGGLEALEALIEHVPLDSMAFIVVQHLAPQHESALPQLLGRSGRLEVVLAVDGMTIEAGRVYVIPPNADLAVMHGVIRVITPPRPHVPRLPIDFTFRSLADDQGPNAIGVVLSGTGTDGTFGLQAIKAAGGLTFVQEPSTARYDGMPRSALASGAADFCLVPECIGEELVLIAQRPRLPRPPRAPAPPIQDQLSKLFVLIRAEFGNDLTQYKQSTIDRRIERRMTLHRIARLDEYVKFVQQNRGELEALYKDMLITVTSFFRDPESFEELKRQVFPRLFEAKEPSRPLRVWVPACATGEEAYSIAMCLLEFCHEQGHDARIQIFSTDIDEDCIQHARRGVYAANIALDVSPERLNRFFVKKDNEYVVARSVRDLIVFSKQNILRDAPFSRMDLVTCRNLLIYLHPAAQKRVLRVIHYALNPSGHLLLGTSETVGDAPELFSAVDRKSKIYSKKPAAAHGILDVGFGAVAPLETPQQAPPVRPTLSLQGLADRKVLDLYGPPGVVLNEALEILQFRGHTGPYLDPAPGTASWNLLRLVRLELHAELKKALAQAQSQQQRVKIEVTFPNGGKPSVVRLDVVPLEEPESRTRCLLVLFHQLPAPKEVPVLPPLEGTTDATVLSLGQRIKDLERELAVTKEYLQTTIEEKESTLEELKSANEELQSSNEELQSTNEELETSKEEMQSTNEELTTVNDELQNRMAELSQTNDDLHNVLAGVDNPVVIVGMDLKIRRYTTAAEKLLNLVPGDIGRSVGFLDTFLGTGPLEPKVSSVIQNLATLEEEMQASNQRWYAVKVTPYKTLDHSIRGALVTLVDIDIRKRAQEMTRDVAVYADRFLAAISHPLMMVDRKLRVVWCNDVFLDTFQLSSEETIGNMLEELGEHRFAQSQLRERLEQVSVSGSVLRGYELRVPIANAHQQLFRVGASRAPAAAEAPVMLLSFEHVDEPAP